MTKRKVIIVSLNRSEYSRIRSVIKALLAREDLDTQVAVLHSKFANNGILLEKDGIPIHHRVFISIDERSHFKTATAISEVTQEFAKLFDKEKPDMLVILGDRYEALGVVIAAAFQNIFIAHIQGGEVTGTHDEHTRHAISKMSHLHFPSTELSRERLIKMGERPDMVFNVGCPGTDLLLSAPKLSFEELRYEIYKLTNRKEVIERLEPNFFLMSQFPVPTELKDASSQINATLEAISQFEMPKLILTPIPDAGGDVVEQAVREYEKRDPKAVVIKHLPPDLFVNAMRHASLMLGNSSGGIRETGYFGLPTLNIGSRQTGREKSSNVIDVPHDRDAIISAIKRELLKGRYEPQAVYGQGGAGEEIARIVAEVDYTQIQKRLTY